MTCEEVVKRLYDSLNSGVPNLTAEIMEMHFRLCQTTCSHCKFDAEVIRALQESCFGKKPSMNLLSRIRGDIEAAL
jgi:hypothetical protein